MATKYETITVPPQFLIDLGLAQVTRAPCPRPFELVDQHTGRVVGTYKTRTSAYRAADRRDNKYGAYRYRVRLAGDK